MEFAHGVDFVRLDYRLFGLSGADAQESNDPVWELRANVLQPSPSLAPTAVPVAGVEGAFLASEVLRESECELLIRLAEQIGFTSGKDVVDVPVEVRDNDVCVVLAPQPLVVELCRRLLPLVPSKGNGGEPLASPDFVNARFRVYRYHSDGDGVLRSAQSFGPHYDGAQASSGVSNGRLVEDVGGSTVRSQMSVLLYLSDGHEGGETIFYPNGFADSSDFEEVCVSPERGAALCFWHGEHPLSPLHAGAAVRGGAAVKYVIRTDILYCGEAPSVFDQEWNSSKTVMAMQRAAAVMSK
mmetsp:Transcript_19613/g.53728  ORF Transcript_19613/g.53728 Transcript_19613/m.53728 type:complete len:297 (-) Transcript_19613:104-994(-)